MTGEVCKQPNAWRSDEVDYLSSRQPPKQAANTSNSVYVEPRDRYFNHRIRALVLIWLRSNALPSGIYFCWLCPTYLDYNMNTKIYSIVNLLWMMHIWHFL